MNATSAARQRAGLKPGETRRMCDEDVSHKVLGSFGYRPACTEHAKGAAENGYPVAPAL